MSDRETAYKILNDIFNNDMLYQDALASALENAKKAGEDVNKAWVTRLVKGVTERYLSRTASLKKPIFPILTELTLPV